MKYIKKIILKNFQSHEYTEIDLDERLNVIVGSSNSGKTSILRAIKWVLYNEPTGDFFIREGETEASVSLIFSDGKKVERYRSPSKNQYRIYPADGGEAEIYQGFGLNVPHEVEEATGIKKIMLDSKLANPINLSEQLEGAFLLSESDSVKASSIGRLIGVNIIDDALRGSLLDLRQLNSEKKRLDKDKIELEEEYKEYEYLTEYEKRLDKLKLLRESMELKLKLLKDLELINEKLDYIEKEKTKYLLVQEKLFSIKDLEIGILSLDASLKEYDKLVNLDFNYKELKRKKEEEVYIKNILKNLDNIDDHSLSLKVNRLKKLEELNSRLRKNTKAMGYYEGVLSDLKSIDSIDYDLIEIKLQTYSKLNRIFLRKINVKERLKIGSEYISKFANIESTAGHVKLLDDMLKLESSLIKLKDKYSSIQNQKSKINNSLEGINKRYTNDILSYKSILEKQEVCPYCFNKIDGKHLDQIIKNYYEE